MTVTQNPHDTGWTSVNDSPAGRPPWRSPVLLGTAAVVLAAAVGGGALIMARDRHPGPAGPADAPAALPDQVQGLSQAGTDTAKGQQKAFEEKAQKLGDITVVGRTYTSENNRRTIKVVVGRTDLTGKLDLAWAADKGRDAGNDAHCTSKLQLTPDSKPSVRPTMLLCWRTTDSLSAYSLIIDFDRTPKDSDGVAALMEAWRSA